jgi:hypothetical protein
MITKQQLKKARFKTLAEIVEFWEEESGETLLDNFDISDLSGIYYFLIAAFKGKHGFSSPMIFDLGTRIQTDNVLKIEHGLYKDKHGNDLTSITYKSHVTGEKYKWTEQMLVVEEGVVTEVIPYLALINKEDVETPVMVYEKDLESAKKYVDETFNPDSYSIEQVNEMGHVELVTPE